MEDELLNEMLQDSSAPKMTLIIVALGCLKSVKSSDLARPNLDLKQLIFKVGLGQPFAGWLATWPVS